MYLKWLTENLINQKRRNIHLAFIAAILLLSGCSLLPDEDEKEIVPVITAPKISGNPEYEVQKGTIEVQVHGSGKLLSYQEETLYFAIENRRVEEIYVQSGDEVQAGQIIAELDMGDLDSQIRKKEIEVAIAELEMKEILRMEQSEVLLEKAKLDFEQTREELTSLMQSMEDAVIRAPYNGTIVSTSVKSGDLVSINEEVAAIADLTKLIAGATFTSDDLQYIVPGMEVEVSINTAGVHKGKVNRLPVEDASGASPDSGSLDSYLLADLDQWPEGLNRGTPLSISVIVERKENILIIPSAALRTQNSRNYVLVAGEDGTKGEVDVEIGISTSTEIEVIKGLTAGQKVVGK